MNNYATSKESKNYQNFIVVLFLVTYLGLQLWRGWDVFRFGRFWAEDGSMIWAHALGHNVVSQITYIPPIAGYFDMNANLYVLISTLFPILFAPYVVLALSLLTMLLPAIFVILIRPRSITQSAKNFLAFSLLFGPGLLSAEAFGNAVNGQTYLGLYAGLTLVFWPDWLSKRKQYFVISLLTLAMLSGWYSVILAPLLMIRAREKSVSPISKFCRWIPLLFLGVQGYALVITSMHHLQWPGRNDFTAKWYMPFLNISLLPGKAIFGDLGIAGYSASLLGFLIFLYCTKQFKLLQPKKIKAIKQSLEDNLVICWLSLILELSLIGFGQAGRSFGGRYLIVPSGIFFLLLVLILQHQNFPTRRSKKIFIAMGSLVGIGLIFFLRIPSPELKCLAPCVSWAEQIHTFKSGGTSLIMHWPNNLGVPNFATDLRNPRVRLAPFQADALGLSDLELDN